jgi:hypothetical protein
MPVLRPLLYACLCRAFGRVKVVHEGEACQASLAAGQWPFDGPTLEVHSWGETYAVCCPFCGDTRYRLYVNHRWALRDERVGSDNLWMAKCFNEDCLRNLNLLFRLRTLVLEEGRFSSGDQGADLVLPGAPRQHRGQPGRPAMLPGPITRLDRLVPDHPARAYLEGRGFDSALQYGVAYCAEPAWSYPMTLNRLILPVQLHGKLVGWQARCVGERDWSGGVPKYYTMPGMKTSQTLYNFDRAARCPFVVLTEGATDVWRFGPEAVALFGKNLSEAQFELIAGVPAWREGCVIVLLDGDAKEEGRKIKKRLARWARHAVWLGLPEGWDPGRYSTERLREVVFSGARRSGIDLTALKATSIEGPAAADAKVGLLACAPGNSPGPDTNMAVGTTTVVPPSPGTA